MEIGRWMNSQNRKPRSKVLYIRGRPCHFSIHRRASTHLFRTTARLKPRAKSDQSEGAEENSGARRAGGLLSLRLHRLQPGGRSHNQSVVLDVGPPRRWPCCSGIAGIRMAGRSFSGGASVFHLLRALARKARRGSGRRIAELPQGRRDWATMPVAGCADVERARRGRIIDFAWPEGPAAGQAAA